MTVNTHRRLGIGGHQSANSGTDVWLTPPDLLNRLGGDFDLDPCAAPLPRPWTTAREHYTWPHQNGLLLPWFGRVWLNPPYGRAMAGWLRRMAQHGRGTALIFARTDTECFHSSVFGEAHAILFLKGRLTFCYPDGRPARYDGGAPSVLIAYGTEDTERLLDSGIEGAIVGLKRPVLIHLAMTIDPPGQTWREVVADTLRSLGGRASLRDLYDALCDHPKAKANQHWQAKIRQTVAKIGLSRIAEGQYEFAL
ncbi:DNA N-6-adenine-methyltransferase [Microvirga tunisiensis]|uniref:Adenine methyltransferase n=1 Tax=Microvirga tunisiensis TaxID=2108360 RepID=A0A5N7MNB5_9HYPH|nr:DNA N-6-adenine-methyltransferase [Microvirga tunisiensis]MPR10131.1 adenine methyltransferase [Microvirga tunisiensis]MPR28338.1 adenine methyltransferase [Microvirga tunisiensis]